MGDDAAVIGVPSGRVVAATDLLIEGRHFRRDWSAAADIGAKAAARNLADVAAMGARPTAILVGLAAPGDLAVDWVLDLYRGMALECAAAGASVAGGDTSGAETVMLAVTALGEMAGSEPVTRGGARPGDVLAVAGTLGSAAAGLALLAAGLAPPAAPARADGEPVPADRVPNSPAAADLAGLVRAQRRPRPAYDAGPQAAAAGATSMIDVSDGLIADLGHIAAASGVRIQVRSGQLGGEPVARAGALRAAARLLSADWMMWVLTGGEDHALAATYPPELALPPGWTAVGDVTRGSGVVVDGRVWSGAGGWDHFLSVG
jgi:thiamine-monophosphate kinase